MNNMDTDTFLAKLSPGNIADKVDKKYHNYLLGYRINSNTITTSKEHDEALGTFMKGLVESCISNGGDINLDHAISKSRLIINQSYERKFRGNYTSAFKDAKSGANGGLHAQFQMLVEHHLYEERELHIQRIFNQYINQHDFDSKCEFIKGFLDKYGKHLGDDIETNRPERYTHRYIEIVRSYVDALSQTSGMFNSF